MSLLPTDQGILFLPNHPALMDPIILISYLTKRFRVCPLAAEAQVQKKPWAFRVAETLPVPDFGEGTNSFTKHLMNQVLDRTVKTLESGKCVLMYPAGRLMRTGRHFEELGTSATFDIVNCRRGEHPWRVVLVHTDGLWGSRFSCAYSPVTPDFMTEFRAGLWDLFACFLFFMPKRKVDISFEEVELQELQRFQDKVQLNRWLMSKYNASGDEGLLKPGDDLYVKGKGRVPYRCCTKDSVKSLDKPEKSEVTTGDDLDPKMVQKVTGALAKHLGVPQESLALNKKLSHDLGMDSIQLGELIGWLDQEFNVQDVSALELTTVASVVGIVSGRSSGTAKPSTGRPAPDGWEAAVRPGLSSPSECQNLTEAFLRNAKHMGKAVMAGDEMSGVITYDRALLGAMLFADFFLAHPERIAQGRIGVMMPAAAGVGIIVLGIMLAGCAPVMINWTVGRASLEHVLNSTGIKTVVTAARFLKKLGPEVDLTPLLEREGLLLFTEDLKENKLGGFGKMSKLGALMASKKSAEKLMKRYKLNEVTGESEAVVLFTSGSESYPKGVPLSHGNVLSNIVGMLEAAGVKNTDCLFGILPPFHSFGFTVTTMGPAISGLKVAYYPNPTEYRRISREIARWKPTIFLGTPTFANGILQAAKADREKAIAAAAQAVPEKSQHKSGAAVVPMPTPDSVPWPTASLRLMVTGAEKTPEALFELTRDQHSPPVGIIEGYGITETSPVLTANRPGKERTGVGWSIRNTALALLSIDKYLLKDFEVIATCDADHNVQGPVEKEGVIIAQGPGVFGAPQADPPRAYLGIPLSQKNPFVWVRNSWWYDTGDLGYFDETGALHLSGRLKRFAKIAGEMVSLVALEAALKLRARDDGSKPWADTEDGPVVAVETYEADGEKPVLGLISAVDATLEEANAQLQAAGMPKIARLTVLVDGRTAFEERWAKQGTLPLLGTGKSDYAQMKRALAAAVERS